MEFTAAASWLNSFFAGFDNTILEFMHTLENSAGSVLTPLAKFITLIGEKGLWMFALAFVLMLFAKTRKLGLCLFGAVCCGALITNIILKDLIARPRPFEAMAPFMKYWQAVGSPPEDGFSFPSGHVTAAAAGMTAIFLVKGRKFILPAAIYVFLMCFSRNYLMAHYPSDVLAASLVGLFSGFAAYGIGSFIYNYLEDNDDLPFFGTLVNFSLPLPDMSGLVKKLNRVPNRPAKAAKQSKKSAAGHERRDENEGAHSAKVERRREDTAPISAPEAQEEQPGTGDEQPRRTGRSHAAKAKGSVMPAALGDTMSKLRSKAASVAPRAEKLKAAAAVLPKVKTEPRPQAEEAPSAAAPAEKPELDFDFSSPKKAQRPTSDWNERWEAYRKRRDEAAVKTAPAAPGSSQMEFENIFAAGDDDVKIFDSKKPAAPAEAVSGPADSPDKDFLINTGILDTQLDTAGFDSLFESSQDFDVESNAEDEAEPAEDKAQAAVEDGVTETSEAAAPAEEPVIAAAEEPVAEKKDESPVLGGSTGSIELDMDEIYSILDGSYDFSRG